MIPISAPLESVDTAEGCVVEDGDTVVAVEAAVGVVDEGVTLEGIKDDVEGMDVDGVKEDVEEGVAVEEGRGVAVGEAVDGDDEGGYKPP